MSGLPALPLFAQHMLRTVMTVVHEADSDGVHTVPTMADAERYTIHTEADHQGAPDIRDKSYLLLPQATEPEETMSDECNEQP